MAFTPSENLRIVALENAVVTLTTTLSDISSKTKEPNALTVPQIQAILDAIGNPPIDINSPSVKAGYIVQGQKAGVYNGAYVIAKVLSLPIADNSDLEPPFYIG